MGKIYYKFFSSTTIPTNNPFASRVYTWWYINNVVYGFDDRPYNYIYNWIDGSYRKYFAEQTLNRDSSTEVSLGRAGNTNTPNSSIYFAVDENSTADIFLRNKATVLPQTIISGRYRILRNTIVNFTDTVSALYIRPNRAKIPMMVNFTIDGVLYKGFSIVDSATSSTSTTFNGNMIELCKSDNTIESYTLVEFGEQYNNSIIEFERTSIPTIIVEWLKNILGEIYPYTYTVKDFTGDEILSSISESPSMTNALLSTVGNFKTLTLTGINGQTYRMQWESETPEGKIFLGLSTSPNSNRPTLLTNTNTAVSWVGDLVFYESYGKYRPPATTFDINLYQNSAEVNRVDKGNYLVGVGSLSGALREECSMLTPSIVYQSSDVPTFNYVYIPIFNRYYFVTSLSSVNKNVWRMELKCDVLMTYKNEILLLQGVVGRQEIDFNPMLVDSDLPTQDNPEVEIVNIPSTAFKSHTNVGGNFYNFVLTVIG